jgi:hypothetical protein
MISPPPYSRWREITSLFSAMWCVLRYRGNLRLSTSAWLFLTHHVDQYRVDNLFQRLTGEREHCKTAAERAVWRALDTIAMAEKRGILPSVKKAHQARKGGR